MRGYTRVGVGLSGSDSILANYFTFLHLPLDFHAYLLRLNDIGDFHKPTE